MQSVFTIERKRRGLAKKTLYNACNLSAQTWQKLEEFPKHFKISELEIISSHFNCSIAELVQIVGGLDFKIPEKKINDELDNIHEIKTILRKENITWREFSKLTNDYGQSNLKRNLDQWSKKINMKINKIGYSLIFKKKE